VQELRAELEAALVAGKRNQVETPFLQRCIHICRQDAEASEAKEHADLYVAFSIDYA
jgi:hypothetical protein